MSCLSGILQALLRGDGGCAEGGGDAALQQGWEEPISSSTLLSSLAAHGSRLCNIHHQHNQHHQALDLGVVLWLGPKGKVLSVQYANKKRSRAMQPQAKDIFNVGKERQAGDGTMRPELQRLQMGFSSRALSLLSNPAQASSDHKSAWERTAKISGSHN